MPSIHPSTTAPVPSWELVVLWASLSEIGVPSANTPQVFDVVAPLSVPR
jgi:hypothetical protein